MADFQITGAVGYGGRVYRAGEEDELQRATEREGAEPFDQKVMEKEGVLRSGKRAAKEESGEAESKSSSKTSSKKGK